MTDAKIQILYHHPICPLSRQVRIYLKELGEDFSLIKEDYWLRRPEFLEINPAATVPALSLPENKHNISGLYAIIEYMADKHKDFFLMPNDILERAQMRQMMSWFNEKFYREVTKILIDEKMIRLLMRAGEPRSAFIRAAKSNLNNHLKFLSGQLALKPYLVSEKISCADIAAAAQISTLDYFGEINWDSHSVIKNWYSIIKSRPSFQGILQDRIAGFNPSAEYAELDF